jgi:hypothetical protein
MHVASRNNASSLIALGMVVSAGRNGIRICLGCGVSMPAQSVGAFIVYLPKSWRWLAVVIRTALLLLIF